MTAVALLVLIALFGGVLWFQSRVGRVGGPAEGRGATAPPRAQAPECPDVRVFTVPGTHESTQEDDPFNPTTEAIPGTPAMLLGLTRPVGQKYPKTRADAYTIPYNSGFKVVVGKDSDEKTFDQSVDQGTQVLRNTMQQTAERCPLTKYFLVGYSQGAVIVGDIASEIGQQGAGEGDGGVVKADKILGAVLLADGRRVPGQAVEPGTKVDGGGVEVVLKDSIAQVTSVAGFTMMGAREGGFGELKDRVYEICGTGDLICDAPQSLRTDLPALLDLPGQLLGGPSTKVHTSYGTTEHWRSEDGKPAMEWIKEKAMSLINQAPSTH